MDLLFGLFLIYLVLSLMVGVVALPVLVFKIFAGGGPKPAPAPKPAAQPPPRFPQPTRGEKLALVQAEVDFAWHSGALSAETYVNVCGYLDRQVGLVTEAVVVPLSRAAVAAGEKPMKESNPGRSEPRERSPEEIRAAIAKLHADAQAPEPEIDPPASPETPAPVGDGRKEADAAPAGAAPHAAPDRPAPESAAAPGGPIYFSPKKTWAERLFTPENVRILQSLGIGIIFISAVAFVRTQMWNTASVWSQLGLIAAGTACCSALGLALRHFTQLRLTALCFLILGQLSLLIDVYAVMVFHEPAGAMLYPHSHASLWTIGFALFAAAAFVQARVTKESLFDAFTYFGGLAAWGAGMLWLDTSVYLLPATFVPFILVSSIIARDGSSTNTLQRWSLCWWLSSGVDFAAPIFCLLLPVAALWGGRAVLSQDFFGHAAAMVLLADALLLDALRGRKGYTAHVPALLLVSIAPLATHAFGWARQRSDVWPAVLALPGFGLALIAAAVLHFSAEARAKVWRQLLLWGTGVVLFGFLAALICSLHNPHSVLLLIVALVTFATGVAAALLLKESSAPWLATAAAALAVVQITGLTAIPAESWPLCWLFVAGACYAGWRANRIVGAEVGRSGMVAADFLAAFAGAWLFAKTTVLPLASATAVTDLLRVAWPALAAYVLITSRVAAQPIRRGIGIALLGAALVPPVLTNLSAMVAMAPWLALAAIAVMAVMAWLDSLENDRPYLLAGLFGSGAIVVYASLLSLLHATINSEIEGGVALMLTAAAVIVLALLVRGRAGHPRRGALLEMAGLLELAAGIAFLAVEFGVSRGEWPLVLAMLSALLLLLGLALEALAGGWLGTRALEPQPSAFLDSRTLVVGLLTGVTLLSSLQHGALQTSQIDVTWRALLSVSILALYFSFATLTRTAALNSLLRLCAAGVLYLALLPGTWLVFLKAQSTGSSWGALWFLALTPVLLTAAYVLRKENELRQARLAMAGAGFVGAGALVLAFAGNRENLAAVPCATLAALAGLSLLARRVTASRHWTGVACLAFFGASFYALRVLNGSPAWNSLPANVLEMPVLTFLGLAALWLGGHRKLEQFPGDRTSLVAWHGFGLSLFAWCVALLQVGVNSAHVALGPVGNTLRLDGFILSTAALAPLFFLAPRYLPIHGGRYLGSLALGLAYVMQVWKSHPDAWEWYTLPLAGFAFLLAWKLAEEKDFTSAAEVNVVLGLASGLALLPSFIQGMPWHLNDLQHVLVLALVGFAMVFGAMMTRRKIPLLTASAAMLLCLAIHAIYLALHRDMMLPVAGLIAGFAVLAVATLLESRMNANLRDAVDRAKAEAHMFWVSWN